jgi:hypothetical protein
MSKRILLLTILSLACLPAMAQTVTKRARAEGDTVKWTKGGSFNIGFANVGLSNWAGGGQNSISIGSILDGKAVRETNKSVWTSYLNYAIGGARVGGSNQPFKKTDDLFVAGTKYGYKINERWSYSANLELRTQSAIGWTYRPDPVTGREVVDRKISNFMAPGYLFTGLGFQYKNKIFTANLNPIANRLTFVLDEELSNAGAFGVDPGQRVKSDLGPNVLLALDWNVLENINWKSQFNGFAKYADLARIDWTWDNIIAMKVNKYINVALTTNMIYFNDVLIRQSDGRNIQAVQFKHVLSVNFGFKF